MIQRSETMLHQLQHAASAMLSLPSDSSRAECLEAALLHLQDVVLGHAIEMQPVPHHNGVDQPQPLAMTRGGSQQQPGHGFIPDTQAELQALTTEMKQLQADLVLKTAIVKEQRQELGSLLTQCEEDCARLTALVQQQRHKLSSLRPQLDSHLQEVALHKQMLQQMQESAAHTSAAAQKQQVHNQGLITQLQQQLDSQAETLFQHQDAAHHQQQQQQLASQTAKLLQSQADLQSLRKTVQQQQDRMTRTHEAVHHHQQQQLTSQTSELLQSQAELHSLRDTIQQQRDRMTSTDEALQLLRQVLEDKEVLLTEQHEQLLQQDGLLRQQRELLVNQDNALQVARLAFPQDVRGSLAPCTPQG